MIVDVVREALLPLLFYSTLVIMFVVQGLLVRVGSRRGVDDLRTDAWQVAFVSGGYRRVLDTAIAELAMRSQVLVSRRGRLTVTTGATPDGPFERAVCVSLRGTTSRLTVHRRLRHDPAVQAVDERARSRGLMLHGVRVVWFRLATLPFLASAGVALARVIDDYQQDPVGFPMAGVVISGMIVAVLGLRLRVRHRPSPLGRAMMRQVSRSLPPASTTLTGVALMGFRAIEDDKLRWALQATPAHFWERLGPW
jgi:uncharacterized protein (TIGR04222 family)